MNMVHDAWPILLSLFLGAILGLEREYSGKAAGLRTNVLICVGAAVFTTISGKMGYSPTDSATRIAAQVVSGVGFLGAGAIIQDRGGVYGLTTAATIWLVASIGMACGARMYAVATISAILALIVLIGLSHVEHYLARVRNRRKSRESA